MGFMLLPMNDHPRFILEIQILAQTGMRMNTQPCTKVCDCYSADLI